MSSFRPPRDNLVRAIRPGIQLRAAAEPDAAMPTLFGHFARFGEWTEIDSFWEGRFMEQVASGAFAKTIAENRAAMRVLFQHGMDPQIGNKVLGPISDLREDAVGGYYEVPLLDTSYNRDLIPGLEADQYGASFRFRVMREEIVDEPGVSAHNPNGLPERTIKEAQVMEFGPVTFPAYAGATAGVRSMTDEMFMERLTSGEGLKRFAEFVRNLDHEAQGGTTDPTDPPAPSEDAGETPPPTERRDDPVHTPQSLPRHAEWLRQRKSKEKNHG